MCLKLNEQDEITVRNMTMSMICLVLFLTKHVNGCLKNQSPVFRSCTQLILQGTLGGTVLSSEALWTLGKHNQGALELLDFEDVLIFDLCCE